jgi:hypothetical protein
MGMAAPLRWAGSRLGAVVGLGLLLSSPGLSAQARAEPTAAVRMRAFLRQLTNDRERGIGLESFFPGQGDWLWVHQLQDGPAGTTVTHWRFAPGDTYRALLEEGPVCSAVGNAMGGEFGPVEGSLASAAEAGPWRRTRGSRFVPPGAGPASPIFVEWRREGTRWVISVLGDVGRNRRPRASPEEGIALRMESPGQRLSLPLPDSTTVASERAWYRNNEAISILGAHSVKYSVPRPLGPGDLVRIGTVDGVPAFAEPLRGHRPHIIYLPEDRQGMFQPYEAMHPPCSWGWEYR